MRDRLSGPTNAGRAELSVTVITFGFGARSDKNAKIDKITAAMKPNSKPSTTTALRVVLVRGG